MTRLIDAYDTALFDCDGVVYLGPEAVPGAADGIADLHALGVTVMFVTNNAARPPSAVVQQLVTLGVPTDDHEVVTSAQAGARLLADSVPAGSPVLVVGSQALVDEVVAVGMTPVQAHTDRPAAVIQGYDPGAPWARFDEAAFAIQRGARWFATNTDLNRPTNLGLVPGAGAGIAVVRAAVDIDPQVAGKPFRPLLDEAVRRTGATRPIFVGDRIDTDIEGAHNAGMDSLMVFTGAHDKHDLAHVGPHSRPTHVGYDLRALLEPPRRLDKAGDQVRCNAARAWVDGSHVRVEGDLSSREHQFDALWAVLSLAWSRSGLHVNEALAKLDQVP